MSCPLMTQDSGLSTHAASEQGHGVAGLLLRLVVSRHEFELSFATQDSEEVMSTQSEPWIAEARVVTQNS